MDAEQELLVDPSVGWSLVELLELASARVAVKSGRHSNELVRFRYDLTLRAQGGERSPSAATWIDWESLGPDRLAESLAALDPKRPVFAVRGIPNARLVGLSRALAWLRGSSSRAPTLASLRADAAADDGVAPADLFDLATRSGLRLELGASVEADRCDALFTREAAGVIEGVFGAGAKRPLDECANEPMNRGGSRFAKRLHASLSAVDPNLAARSVVFVVDHLPRTHPPP